MGLEDSEIAKAKLADFEKAADSMATNFDFFRAVLSSLESPGEPDQIIFRCSLLSLFQGVPTGIPRLRQAESNSSFIQPNESDAQGFIAP